MPVTIYHLPRCSTSRNVLAEIRARGIEPEVIEYVKTPPSRADLTRLAQDSGLGVRGLLRQKGTPYEELGLGDMALTEKPFHHALRPRCNQTARAMIAAVTISVISSEMPLAISV